MKKVLTLATIAALVFGSCTSEEVINPTVAPEEQAIGFGTFLDRAPQAAQSGLSIKPLGAVLDLPGLKTSGFTALAYNTGGDDWSAYTQPATPNFMDDVPVTWNAGSSVWEYTPIKFWPTHGSGAWGKVSFFGYATVTGASAAGQAGGNPIIGFTAQSAAAAQVDLVADADIDVTKETAAGKVNFAFNHILSRIGFSAKLAGAYPSATVTVTSLKVYYKNGEVVSKGTYTFSATDNKAAANWSLGSIYFTEVGSGSGDEVTTADVKLTTDKQNINAADRYLMLIPQSGIAAGDMYVELKYTVATDNAPLSTVTKTVDVPAAPGSGDAWLPGKAYTYNFTVTLDAVNFNSDIDVDTWDDNDAAPAAALSVSPAALNFAAAGEDKSFNITSNTAWTVSSNETWLTVSPDNGSNNGAVTVTAAANSGAERAATITVSGTGVTDQIIGVTQEAGSSTGNSSSFSLAWDFSGIDPGVWAADHSPCTISPAITGSVEVVENLTASNFGHYGTNAGRNSWGGDSFTGNTLNNTATTNVYATVKIKSTSKSLSLATLSGNIRHSPTGPTHTAIFYKTGEDAFAPISAISNGSVTDSFGNPFSVNLSNTAALQNIQAETVITVKFVPYGASNIAGTWYFNSSGTLTTTALKIEGTEQ